MYSPADTLRSAVDEHRPAVVLTDIRMPPGHRNAAIAKALALSESSVEKASSTLFAKLGLANEPSVHRRVSAVVTYLRAVGHPGTSTPSARPAVD